MLYVYCRQITIKKSQNATINFSIIQVGATTNWFYGPFYDNLGETRQVRHAR